MFLMFFRKPLNFETYLWYVEDLFGCFVRVFFFFCHHVTLANGLTSRKPLLFRAL
jgi:hypothetical protein